MESIGKEKWEVAESELTKAVKIYPKFAIAWYQLGLVRQKRNARAEPSTPGKKRSKQDPKYVKPYESLAALADRQQDWTAAEQYSREWLQLDPDDFAAAYLINAIANARLNRMEAAELAARAGLQVDKDRKIPRLNYVLGLDPPAKAAKRRMRPSTSALTWNWLPTPAMPPSCGNRSRSWTIRRKPAPRTKRLRRDP